MLDTMFLHYTISQLKKVTAFIIFAECAIVLTVMVTSPMSSFSLSNLRRTARGIRDTLSSCPPQKKEAILNASLPVSVYGNVDLRDDLYSICFDINRSTNGINRLMDTRNFEEISCNGSEKRFLEQDEKPGYTALASYPGSGNTWVRHLLEELTDIHTGSLYMDPGLKKIFKAERYTERVIVIKTHVPIGKLNNLEYSRAILIVRDPYEALLSYFNLLLTNSHTHYPGRQKFINNSFTDHVKKNLPKWLQFNLEWIKNFNGQLFVLFYENLKTDLSNTLTKMAAFLGTDVTLRRLWCVQSRKDGLFRRGPKPDWMERSKIVDDILYKNITYAKEQVLNAARQGRFV